MPRISGLGPTKHQPIWNTQPAPMKHEIDVEAFTSQLRLKNGEIEDTSGLLGSLHALEANASFLLDKVADLLLMLGADERTTVMIRDISIDSIKTKRTADPEPTLAAVAVGVAAMRVWDCVTDTEKAGAKTYPIYFTAIELEALRTAPIPALAEDTSSLTLKHKIIRAKVLAYADRESTPVCRDCMEPWKDHGMLSGDLGDPLEGDSIPSTCVLMPCGSCSGLGNQCRDCGGKGGPGPGVTLGSPSGWKNGY